MHMNAEAMKRLLLIGVMLFSGIAATFSWSATAWAGDALPSWSDGSIEFMRVFNEQVYGVPPEQVIGGSIRTKYEVRDGKPVLLRLPELNFVDDKAGKPVGIQMHIGRRPLAAFGNSDGDFQMIEWTTSGPGPRLGLFVHHDDAEREWTYDRKSSIGRLDRGLDEASSRGWVVVSMKDDWKRVFAFDENGGDVPAPATP